MKSSNDFNSKNDDNYNYLATNAVQVVESSKPQENTEKEIKQPLPYGRFASFLLFKSITHVD